MIFIGFDSDFVNMTPKAQVAKDKRNWTISKL